MKPGNNPEVPLVARSETRFQDPRGPVFEFQVDGQGKVTGAFLEQQTAKGPQKMPFHAEVEPSTLASASEWPPHCVGTRMLHRVHHSRQARRRARERCGASASQAECAVRGSRCGIRSPADRSAGPLRTERGAGGRATHPDAGHPWAAQKPGTCCGMTSEDRPARPGRAGHRHGRPDAAFVRPVGAERAGRPGAACRTVMGQRSCSITFNDYSLVDESATRPGSQGAAIHPSRKRGTLNQTAWALVDFVFAWARTREGGYLRSTRTSHK